MMKYYGCIISVFIFLYSFSFAVGEENKEKAKFFAKQASFFRNEKEDYDKAIEMYRKAIELDPNNFQYHFHLGSTLAWKKKMYNEAIKEFQKALEIDPNNWWVPFVYGQLGGAYMEVGEYDEAIKAIKNNMESLNSDKYHDSLRKEGYAGAYLRLEEIYKKKGDLVQAEEMAKKAKEFRKLAEIATKKFNEEYEKNIKIHREIIRGFSASDIMELLGIFITPLGIVLILLVLISTFRKKRKKPIEYSEVKWGIKEIVILYLVSVIFFGVVFLSLYLNFPLTVNIIGEITGLLLSLLLIILIIYLVKKVYHQSIKDIGLKKEKVIKNIGLGVIGCLVSSIIGLICEVVMSHIALLIGFSYDGLLENKRLEIFTATYPWWLRLSVFIDMVALSPISEEICFRGFLYPGIRKLVGIKWGIFLSALFFGLCHGGEDFGQVFALGVVYGYLYERTKSLIPCIVGHSLTNGISGIVNLFFPSFFEN